MNESKLSPQKIWAIAAFSAFVGAYAAFCLLLDHGGHRPSFGAFIDRHYLLQAGLMAPLSLLGWLIFAWVARANHFWPTFFSVGPSLHFPLLLLFVLPDIAVYLVAGFEALPGAMKWYAPAALAVAFFFTTKTLGGWSKLRVSLASWVVYGLFMASWLR